MKLAVVTDSTATLNKDIKNHPDLFVLPIPVVIDGEIFQEGLDIDLEVFLKKIQAAENFPTTSQPSLGEVLELYREIYKRGYDTILAIHLSSGISGFIRNVETIQSEVERLSLHIFDSKMTATPMGSMVEAALRLNDEGATIDEILQKVENIQRHMAAYMIVDDLNHLVRGGRLSGGVALIGGMLKIKPILTFEDGEIVLKEKIRTSHRAFVRALEFIDERVQEFPENSKFFLLHFEALEKVAEVEERLKEKYPGKRIEISPFGPVIGTHLGKGSIGIGICEY